MLVEGTNASHQKNGAWCLRCFVSRDGEPQQWPVFLGEMQHRAHDRRGPGDPERCAYRIGVAGPFELYLQSYFRRIESVVDHLDGSGRHLEPALIVSHTSLAVIDDTNIWQSGEYPVAIARIGMTRTEPVGGDVSV